MKNWICLALALMLMPSVYAQANSTSEAAPAPSQLYGMYTFEKQLYMNPLSSFMAFDGFVEYYNLSDDTLVISNGAAESKREISIVWKAEPVEEKTFAQSFMMEGFDTLDISAYKSRYQFSLESTDEENVLYRLYLMDGEVWLANIHRDAINTQKQEYIWSIFQIAKSDTLQSISGTTDGTAAFLALLGDQKPKSYDNDTCYDITPQEIGKDTGYRIFKFDTSCASYLLYENEIYPLGAWFGGLGVVSMEATDLNQDGKAELYYTYSFGSGLHRSCAGYFDPVHKQSIVLLPGNLNQDMMVAQNKTGGLSLYKAAFPLQKSFIDYQVLASEYISDIQYEKGEVILNPIP